MILQMLRYDMAGFDFAGTLIFDNGVKSTWAVATLTCAQ